MAKVISTNLQEVEDAIEEVRNQIRQTTSPYRKRDLRKFLSKLIKIKEQLTYENNLGFIR